MGFCMPRLVGLGPSFCAIPGINIVSPRVVLRLNCLSNFTTHDIKLILGGIALELKYFLQDTMPIGSMKARQLQQNIVVKSLLSDGLRRDFYVGNKVPTGHDLIYSVPVCMRDIP